MLQIFLLLTVILNLCCKQVCRYEVLLLNLRDIILSKIYKIGWLGWNLWLGCSNRSRGSVFLSRERFAVWWYGVLLSWALATENGCDCKDLFRLFLRRGSSAISILVKDDETITRNSHISVQNPV